MLLACSRTSSAGRDLPAGVYVAIVPILIWATSVAGVCFGVILWFVAEIIMAPMLGAEVFSTALGGLPAAARTARYLVYGATLGSVASHSAALRGVRLTRLMRARLFSLNRMCSSKGIRFSRGQPALLAFLRSVSKLAGKPAIPACLKNPIRPMSIPLSEPSDDPFVACDAACTAGIESILVPNHFLLPLRWSCAIATAQARVPWPKMTDRLGVRCRLRGIDHQGGSGFLQAVNQRFKQLPHGLQDIIVEQRSHLFPQQAFAAPFGPRRLEQRATELLHLIQKCQHHQRGKHHREVLIAMAKIVLEVIALVFQVLNVSFSMCHEHGPLHEPINRALVHAQVSHPTKMLDFAPDRFPAFDEINLKLGIGLIERHPADKAKAMVNARFAVLTLIIGDTTRLLSLDHLLEQNA